MPFAVTHILLPIILVDFVRDHIFKKKFILPDRYILFAGLAGLLPDIDMLYPLFGMPNLHGTITHSIFFPITFFILFLISYFLKKKSTYKIFLLLFIGFSIHILLDSTFSDSVTLFFPLDFNRYGLKIIGSLSELYNIYAAMDAILLFVWLIHEELEHKISDYF